MASATPLETASGAGLDRQRLEQQLGRLGGTPWQLGQLDMDLAAGLFLPVAQLNALRRQLVQLLAEANKPAQMPADAEATAPSANPALPDPARTSMLLACRDDDEPAALCLTLLTPCVFCLYRTP